MEYKILGKINSPAELKALNRDELSQLCDEARDCIINTVSKNGGHLASNLGAVELTVALHRAFNSPQDAIIFDVGHQSYTHKLLTGRFDRFSTIRTEGGLSGFMRPDESEHDQFVTGHSSNSISAAYGIYKARQLTGEDGTAVAVIGDGAMTGGMAYEALNNAAGGRGNFIIVLNDNKMSISRNVGAMARAFTKLRNGPHYHRFKFAFGAFLLKLPIVGRPLFRALEWIKNFLKALVYRNNVFTAIGYNYLGPVDGHNIHEMEELFKAAKHYNKPSLIHVITTKGKGYPYAESSPKSYHGVSPFDIEAGAEPSGKLSFSAVAGDELCSLAEKNSRICAVTAAMAEGTGLSEFASRYKSRFFDVGIAEAHAFTFSAGLASGGLIPFFAVYSSFLQRAYDQIIHDAAIASLPVKLLVDRAGIVGEDGETHQGIFDTAFLTSIPGMSVYAPSCFEELRYCIRNTAAYDGLTAIRYPRGGEPEHSVPCLDKEYTLISKGGKRLIITYGRLYSEAAAADAPSTDILKLNRIFPFSDELKRLVLSYRTVHFFEEGIRSGGIAEHFLAELTEMGFTGEYHIHAIDGFVPAADVNSALRSYGLDRTAMLKALTEEAK